MKALGAASGRRLRYAIAATYKTPVKFAWRAFLHLGRIVGGVQMAVKLRGEFDNRLRNAGINLRKIQDQIGRERARPETWSAAQLGVLSDFLNTIADLGQALSELANQVRDD